MKVIWTLMEKCDLTNRYNFIKKGKLCTKRRVAVFLAISTLLYSLAGFLIWLVIKSFALSTIDWALCFVGYMGFCGGFLGGILFLCRSEICNI